MLTKAEVQKLQQQLSDQQITDASKYHQLFVQNEAGAKLLQEWLGTYVFGGFTSNDASTTELAKAEARREFVTMITQKISLAESV